MPELLSTLDDHTLTARLHALARDERNLVADFLRHLAELDGRRTFLQDGYSSLWDFCTRGLHLGEGAAGRRIAALRLLTRFPQLEAPLRDGRLNLSTVNLLGPVLTEGNVDDLVARAAFKPKSEVDRLAASVKPREARADGVRRLPAPGAFALALPTTTVAQAPPAAEPSAASPEPTPGPATLLVLPAPPPIPVPERAPAPRPPELRAVTGEQWSLRVTLDDAARADLDTLRSLLSHSHPNGDLGAVIKEALRCAVETHGKRKGAVGPQPRARPNPARAPAPRRSDCADADPQPAPANDVEAPPRVDHIPLAVRRAVWARDGGCCTYVAADGTRCTSRWQLELDHIEPKALGGLPIVEELRLRCRAHNQFTAEGVFGREHMDRFRRTRSDQAALAFTNPGAASVARTRDFTRGTTH